MAHEVANMAYVNNEQLARTGVPWHGLGVSFDSWLTDEEARGVIDWEVELQPQYRRNAQGLYVQVEKANAIVKTDTDQCLGTVGDYYVPFQNRELIELGSILVDDWGAKWDTVMSLKNNGLIVATLRLDVVSGDGRGLAMLDDSDYYSWLMLSNDHTGSRCVNGQVVCTRAVCNNTYQMAKAGGKPGWSVRHTGDITTKAVEAQRTIGLVTQHQKDFADMAEQLAEATITEGEAIAAIEEIFPVTSTMTDRAKEITEGKRTEVQANWLTSSTIPASVRDTKWGLLNGITEWSEHLADHKADKRTNPAERRLLSNAFGGGEQKLRERAIGVLTRA